MEIMVMAMTKMAKQTCKNPYVFVEDVVENVRISWLFVEESPGRHAKNPMFLWKTLWKT